MIEDMQAAPRCGAKTRAGTACLSPAIRGRPRCRKHGGSWRSGAPKRNRNAFKHGWYTAETQEGLRYLRKVARSGGVTTSRQPDAAISELMLQAPVLRLSCRCLFKIERSVEINVLSLRQ